MIKLIDEKWIVGEKIPTRPAVEAMNVNGFRIAEALAAGGPIADAWTRVQRMVDCWNALSGVEKPAEAIMRAKVALCRARSKVSDDLRDYIDSTLALLGEKP